MRWLGQSNFGAKVDAVEHLTRFCFCKNNKRTIIIFGRHHFHGVRAHHRSPARAGLN